MGDMPAAAIRVLLVDDDRNQLILTSALLEDASDAHYQIEWVPDLAPALAAILRAEHDVCILDYRLGAADGLELLAAAASEDRSVPIIFMTGHADRDVERRALALGASDFLCKDEISTPILERSIRHALERARTLAALRASERMWRAVFDRADDAMLLADDAGQYVDGNPAALALLGIEREQLVRRRIHDLVVGYAEEAMNAEARAFREAGSSEGEWRIRRADGEELLVEYRATANIFPGRHLSILRDVTERRRVEEMNRRLAAIVESTDDAIIGATLDGFVTAWNPGAERLFGYSAGEMLGRSLATLAPEHQLEEQRDILARTAGGGRIINRPTMRRRRDGTLIPVSITASPVLGPDGAPTGIAAVIRDATESKEMQARETMADVQLSLGVLAAGVAHEINNPLAAVMANLDFVTGTFDDLARGALDAPMRTEVYEALTDSRAAADRVREIVRDLKTFSHPEDRRREALDVRRVIESSVRMAWSEIRHRARLVKDLGDTPLVYANEARLGQVILNLVVNAAQAIPEGNAEKHEIRISTRTDEAGRALIEVRDTGGGIAPEQISRLFDPFYTTKPVGVGTGLGLAICASIVRDLDGVIDVASTPGKGSAFVVKLPPGAPEYLGERAAAKGATPAPRSGRILIVDDDEAVIRALERILTPEHTVTTTTRAEEALEFLGRGARYDVIFCDLMMPQMTGMDLHARVLELYPDQAEKLVFVTGGAFTPRARAFLDERPSAWVAKPFDAAQLRVLVSERLR